MGLKDFIRAKLVRLERGSTYLTGDVSFIDGYPLTLCEGVKDIIKDDRRIKVEILGFNRHSVSCRIYLTTGSMQMKLIESKGFKKSKIKRLIAQGVLR